MQTAGQAFRKALETVLGGDAFLSRVLIGGFHFNYAPQLEQEGGHFAPPHSPYAVITIPPIPSEKGNGGRDILYRPVIRVIVYADGTDSLIRTDADACARKIDLLLKAMSETITDADDATDDFQVLNFYFQSGINDDVVDRTASEYARIGGDYLGYGYYVHCT